MALELAVPLTAAVGTHRLSRLGIISDRSNKRTEPMIRKVFVSLLLAAFVLTASLAEAQHPKKVPRLGVLFPGLPSTYSLHSDAFSQGLRDVGYINVKTIAIDRRWAGDNVERLPELAAELVRSNIDVIVTSGTPRTLRPPPSR